jgi:AbrB family looped-hinge helix DNA binding protein
MKDIIITPKVDSIGRVMIPKHVRDEFEIKPGDLVEIIIRSR